MLTQIQLTNREHKVTLLENGKLRIELNPQADIDSQLEYRRKDESFGVFDDHGNRVRLRTGNIRINAQIKPLLQHSKVSNKSITFDCTQPSVVAEFKTFTLRVFGATKNALLYSKEYKFEDEDID